MIGEISHYAAFIRDTLRLAGFYSENAVWLLMGTRLQESLFGKYDEQIGGGPALGTFQMEPATFKDIVNHYLKYKTEIAERIKDVCNVKKFNANDLKTNEELAICFARLQYYRRPEPLPDRFDILAMAEYWKKHYNTCRGKGQPEEFVDKFYRYGFLKAMEQNLCVWG